MRRLSPKLLLAVVLVTTAGCSPKENAAELPAAAPAAPNPSVAVKAAPPRLPDWPRKLFFGDLGPVDEKMHRQTREGVPYGYNLDAPGVVVQNYDQPGPTMHGAGAGGTDVYWVKSANVFFIHSRCEGNHIDGFLGPYQGDPREVLKPLSARVP